MNTTAFAKQVSDIDTVNTPSVHYADDMNGYEEFIFNDFVRTTDEPISKWDWGKGAYTVNGSSNRITVDLVHKGLIIQSVSIQIR